MQRKDKPMFTDFRPHSILIIGCGLIGASAASGLRQSLGQDCVIDGVEESELHRDIISKGDVFTHVFSQVPKTARVYDLAILAVPVDTAVELMQEVSLLAEITMDVCSVKQPLCETAQALHLEDKFAPTHPMAGLASEGPFDATANLFTNRSWIAIEGWPAAQRLRVLIESLGALFVTVESAEQHDSLMAVVSHSVHLTSLSSMLAYQQRKESLPDSSAKYCGPAFRDVTRLAASPSSFWTSTLLSNRKQTGNHLRNIIEQLQNFVAILDENDEKALKERLDKAREARAQWEMEKGSIGKL